MSCKSHGSIPRKKSHTHLYKFCINFKECLVNMFPQNPSVNSQNISIPCIKNCPLDFPYVPPVPKKETKWRGSSIPTNSHMEHSFTSQCIFLCPLYLISVFCISVVASYIFIPSFISPFIQSWSTCKVKTILCSSYPKGNNSTAGKETCLH